MILATILFVFFTGSAVLADDTCEPEKQVAYDVPFNMLPKEYFYCATRVTGQNKQFCGLKLVSTDETKTVLNGTYYDDDGMGYYTLDLTKDSSHSMRIKYATTTVPAIEGQTITTYVTEMAGRCMIYVKCFQGGPWAGSEDSGTFTGVVCSTAAACKNSTGAHLVEDLERTPGPELMKPDWDKCPK